jgi:hypothetical protein
MCVLRVTGRQLDVDQHLAASGLTADKVFHAGEPRWMSQPNGERHEVSGFTVEVSRGSWSRLDDQANDAISFLKQHEDAIARVGADPAVEDMRLDFRVNLRIDRQTVMAQFDYFPPELVARAGALGLGLEISIYPVDLLEPAQARKTDGSSRR